MIRPSLSKLLILAILSCSQSIDIDARNHQMAYVVTPSPVGTNQPETISIQFFGENPGNISKLSLSCDDNWKNKISVTSTDGSAKITQVRVYGPSVELNLDTEWSYEGAYSVNIHLDKGLIKGNQGEADTESNFLESPEISLNYSFNSNLEIAQIIKNYSYTTQSQDDVAGNLSDIKITQNGRVVSTCTGKYYWNYIPFSPAVEEPGIYQLEIPANMYIISRDGYNEETGNYDKLIYNEQETRNIKVIGSPFTGMSTYPADGAVVNNLSSILFLFPNDVFGVEYGSGSITLTNNETNEIHYGDTRHVNDQEAYYLIYFNPAVETPGKYTLNVPEGFWHSYAYSGCKSPSCSASFEINPQSGITNVETDNNSSEIIEYYSLEGIRLFKLPESGIVIERRGNKFSKIIL